MVNLVDADAVNTWGQLRTVLRHWDAIERAAGETGPFIYAAARTTFRRIDLTGP